MTNKSESDVTADSASVPMVVNPHTLSSVVNRVGATNAEDAQRAVSKAEVDRVHAQHELEAALADAASIQVAAIQAATQRYIADVEAERDAKRRAHELAIAQLQAKANSAVEAARIGGRTTLIAAVTTGLLGVLGGLAAGHPGGSHRTPREVGSDSGRAQATPGGGDGEEVALPRLDEDEVKFLSFMLTDPHATSVGVSVYTTRQSLENRGLSGSRISQTVARLKRKRILEESEANSHDPSGAPRSYPVYRLTEFGQRLAADSDQIIDLKEHFIYHVDARCNDQRDLERIVHALQTIPGAQSQTRGRFEHGRCDISVHANLPIIVDRIHVVAAQAGANDLRVSEPTY